MSAALAQSLCRACGLCCDGTLFTVVRLRPGEAGALRARGLPVVTGADGADVLRQPCAALDGCDCRIYEARPSPCAAFECNLLHALRDGEVSLDEAVAIVDEARTLARAGDPRAHELLPRHFLGRR